VRATDGVGQSVGEELTDALVPPTRDGDEKAVFE
jgi:hypothetical protein